MKTTRTGNAGGGDWKEGRGSEFLHNLGRREGSRSPVVSPAASCFVVVLLP